MCNAADAGFFNRCTNGTYCRCLGLQRDVNARFTRVPQVRSAWPARHFGQIFPAHVSLYPGVGRSIAPAQHCTHACHIVAHVRPLSTVRTPAKLLARPLTRTLRMPAKLKARPLTCTRTKQFMHTCQIVSIPALVRPLSAVRMPAKW